ncbi:hypothetical protein ACFODZ_02940 [Marinicella sediminis]|uniref:Uncharacterized protein n=1 Tax=Marinicella sediminis TaxID=1792834 RepID=A0ABV7JAR5_9GAMM|nr:hypothetical protein [Marinicella sediminis]
MDTVEAITTLKHLGIRTRVIQGTPLHLHVMTDEEKHELRYGNLKTYKWVCFIEEINGSWQVSSPPILTPGPGPTCKTMSLADAVELTISLFQQRHKLHGHSTKQQYENAIESMKKWCDEKDYDGSIR